MQRIVADVPMTELPSWAVWERRLFDDMGDAVQPFLDHFCRDDGEFIWEDAWGGGSADDYYEPFFAWPLVYLMGGGEHLLSLADRQWDAVTRQLTRMGTIHKEYGIAADNMHQSEQDNSFYSL